jgi:ribosome-associated protein
LRWAVEAAQAKKASDVTVLDLTELAAFTDYFLLCTGFSTPQLKAIGDGIEARLEEHGNRTVHREGRAGSEWLLLDYGRFIVHIFSERLREYYDIERLWRAARRIKFPDTQSEAPEKGERLA